MRTIRRICAGPARVVALLALIAVATAPARATVILGNLSATGNHAVDISQGGALAVEFAMTGNFGLTSVVAFLNFPNNAVPSDITVSILNDNGGTPGSSIATLAPAPFTPNPFPNAGGDFTFDAAPGTVVPLLAGSDYWLEILFNDGTKVLNWSSANTGQPYTGSGATFVQALASANEVTWSAATYLDASGAPVAAKPHFELDTPEPATSALSLGGISAILLAARAAARRRNLAR